MLDNCMLPLDTGKTTLKIVNMYHWFFLLLKVMVKFREIASRVEKKASMVGINYHNEQLNRLYILEVAFHEFENAFWLTTFRNFRP